ncbi:DUF2345 domain-containing protein, partial [Tenebrionicola larvae]
GAHKDFTVAAGKQISLYSREGAKLFSSHNNIDIQAQGGDVTTWSTQNTHISSGKKLIVTAQDELTLVCGGGYIKIKGGNVEIGGPGKLRIKNAGISKQGPASMQGVMKNYAPESFDEKFIIRSALTKEPLGNRAYKITMPDGSIVTGITNADGATSLNASTVIDEINITLLKGM